MDKKAIFENLKIDVRILVVTNAGTFDGKSQLTVVKVLSNLS